MQTQSPNMRSMKDMIWPPVRKGDILLSARKRLLSILSLSTGLVGLVSALLSLPVTLADYPVRSIIALLGPALFFAGPVILDRTGAIKTLSATLIGSIYGMILFQALSIGGAANPVLIYLIGLPVLATFLIGYRSGIVTGALVVLTYGSIYAFNDLIPVSSIPLTRNIIATWNTIVLVLLGLSLTAWAALFQREMERANRRLDDARCEADKANMAKSDLLAHVSHEIRTPMNGILGMAQSLKDTPLSVDQKRQVDLITSSGDMLMAIINDVLDLAKVEAGALELSEREFDLRALVDNACQFHDTAARRKGLTLKPVFGELPARWVLGDPHRIAQILNNLISNAVKFTHKGEINVDVGCTGPDMIEFRVRDSGDGIDADLAARIFTPFSQASAETSHTHGGTGLGLAICRNLCTLMNGEIELESSPGAGSTFIVRLPLRVVRDEPIDPANSAASAPDTGEPENTQSGTIRPLHILAADDNETNRLVLSALLQRHPVELSLVEDGKSAVAAWQSGHFDLILMDVRMPVMDGLAATREIRALENRHHKPATPIIALTANVMKDQIRGYRDIGMDGVLAKPISPDRLDALLQSVSSKDGRASPIPKTQSY